MEPRSQSYFRGKHVPSCVEVKEHNKTTMVPYTACTCYVKHVLKLSKRDCKNTKHCTILVFTSLSDELGLVEPFPTTLRLDRMRAICAVFDWLKQYCIICCIVHIILPHTLVVGFYSYKMHSAKENGVISMVNIAFQGTTAKNVRALSFLAQAAPCRFLQQGSEESFRIA